MSKYPPTTDVVRALYGIAGKPEAFDRWLAGVRRQALEEGYDRGREDGYNDAREYHAFGYGCGPDPWDCDCENPYRKEIPNE